MASINSKSGTGSYRAEMDEAERASRDEIMALQTRRLGWSLAHAYDNVAHYRKAFDAAGVGHVPKAQEEPCRERKCNPQSCPQLSLGHIFCIILLERGGIGWLR